MDQQGPAMNTYRRPCRSARRHPFHDLAEAAEPSPFARARLPQPGGEGGSGLGRLGRSREERKDWVPSIFTTLSRCPGGR